MHARAVLKFCRVAKEKTKEQLKVDLGRQEHRRWIAWTRAEGYAFGETRDDIAKTNPYLVGWDKLYWMEEETRAKDTIDTALLNIRAALRETQTKNTCV